MNQAKITSFDKNMEMFQKHGGFSIPVGERELWRKGYNGSNQEAFALAIGNYLSSRKDRDMPTVGSIREFYKSALLDVTGYKPVEKEDGKASVRHGSIILRSKNTKFYNIDPLKRAPFALDILTMRKSRAERKSIFDDSDYLLEIADKTIEGFLLNDKGGLFFENKAIQVNEKHRTANYV